MSRFIEGQDRSQVTLLPECLDDYIAQDNTVRVVDAFINELDMVVCPLKAQCTPSGYRRITRWEHEEVSEAVQRRLESSPESMTIRRSTVEHVFGTLKGWMGYTLPDTPVAPRRG